MPGGIITPGDPMANLAATAARKLAVNLQYQLPPQNEGDEPKIAMLEVMSPIPTNPDQLQRESMLIVLTNIVQDQVLARTLLVNLLQELQLVRQAVQALVTLIPQGPTPGTVPAPPNRAERRAAERRADRGRIVPAPRIQTNAMTDNPLGNPAESGSPTGLAGRGAAGLSLTTQGASDE